MGKDKLTLTESIIALVIAIACVALIAVFLVEQIEYIVCHHGISDTFMGLILVPLVEKISGKSHMLPRYKHMLTRSRTPYGH